MKIRPLQRPDLDVHYFKLLSGLSASLDIDFTIDIGGRFNRLWSEFILNDNYHILVSVSHPYILGTASLFIEQKINGKSAGHIEDVVVDTSMRGLGVGSALIESLIKIAKRERCYKVILNCSDKNIPFYSKFGFLKIDNGMKLVL